MIAEDSFDVVVARHHPVIDCRAVEDGLLVPRLGQQGIGVIEIKWVELAADSAQWARCHGLLFLVYATLDERTCST